jgi:hypothetical protein
MSRIAPVLRIVLAHPRAGAGLRASCVGRWRNCTLNPNEMGEEVTREQRSG